MCQQISATLYVFEGSTKILSTYSVFLALVGSRQAGLIVMFRRMWQAPPCSEAASTSHAVRTLDRFNGQEGYHAEQRDANHELQCTPFFWRWCAARTSGLRRCHLSPPVPAVSRAPRPSVRRSVPPRRVRAPRPCTQAACICYISTCISRL